MQEKIAVCTEWAQAGVSRNPGQNQDTALHRITKVRQFQQLALLSEADGHLQQRIKQLLKLSKEKWDAACEHAKTAVQVLALTLHRPFAHIHMAGGFPVSWLQCTSRPVVLCPQVCRSPVHTC
jgi:hypothetical protein